MNDGPSRPVLLLPGGITPAAHAFAELQAELGDNMRTVLKDHEVYAGPAPPPGWDLRLEADACAALIRGLPEGRAHVVGYSLGADVALRLLAHHADLVASAVLVEPEWIGDAIATPAEEEVFAEGRALAARDPEAAMRLAVRAVLAPGVEVPALPGGPAPPWMASRLLFVPIWLAGEPDPLDVDALRRYTRPVYVAHGEGSAPRFAAAAERLAARLPNVEVELYADSHHLRPPHRHEAKRFAAAAMRTWRRAEELALGGEGPVAAGTPP